ncbi:hypothetical protein [Candidatus Enterococcus clewellii]|uniref:Uncharacterized protein n=1 Tax=Candidatus Enterococcus clewellii TaxID=1834193 RepID=A0A242KCX7_9ENTE|nr:hypothetical protein [Enterococcus sp. 9E7_DIV0242]OTP19023.1 hypothetical protein A5888_000837 [Enterococcus sp. 9E7_DIV0242]
MSEAEPFLNCGEEYDLLDIKLWEKILVTKEYKGVEYFSSFVIDFTDGQVRFAEKYDGFKCGIIKRRFVKRGYTWEPILFYRLSKGWQRVKLENTICKNCDWLGRLANPGVVDLYFFLPNRFELAREASKLEQVRCPKCGGPLNQDAIWVEPYEPEGNEK